MALRRRKKKTDYYEKRRINRQREAKKRGRREGKISDGRERGIGGGLNEKRMSAAFFYEKGGPRGTP